MQVKKNRYGMKVCEICENQDAYSEYMETSETRDLCEFM